MKQIWDQQSQVRLLAAVWYQHITGKQANVRPSRAMLSAGLLNGVEVQRWRWQQIKVTLNSLQDAG